MVLFSHSFCLHIVNFMHSDWSITQNVNKCADWLTLFALVVLGDIDIEIRSGKTIKFSHT